MFTLTSFYFHSHSVTLKIHFVLYSSLYLVLYFLLNMHLLFQSSLFLPSTFSFTSFSIIMHIIFVSIYTLFFHLRLSLLFMYLNLLFPFIILLLFLAFSLSSFFMLFSHFMPLGTPAKHVLPQIHWQTHAHSHSYIFMSWYHYS